MKQVLACTTDCTALQNVSKSYVGHCSGTKVTRQAYQTYTVLFLLKIAAKAAEDKTSQIYHTPLEDRI